MLLYNADDLDVCVLWTSVLFQPHKESASPDLPPFIPNFPTLPKLVFHFLTKQDTL